MRTIRFAASVCLAVLSAAAPSVLPGLVITDSFSGNGTLDGSAVESASSGSYTWSAQAIYNTGFYRNNGTAVVTDITYSTARITRLAWVNQTIAASDIATYSLDVQLNPGVWTSISFLDSPESVYDSAEWNAGVLTLRLDTAGNWSVLGMHYGFNSQDVVAQGASPTFYSGGWNNLTLEFNRATNMASASVNGVQVLAPMNPYASYYPNNPSFQPTVTAAGFHMYGGYNNGAAVDNFSLTVVPEARSLLLAGFGLAAIVIFRRRSPCRKRS